MRVVAGQAKGKRLRAPRGTEARYTSDFVREALFNILAPQMPDARFLDLFAGVGSVGLEAASRGAPEVVLIEKDPVRVSYLARNAREAGLSQSCRVYRQDVFVAVDILRRRGAQFEIIFLDPPYSNELAPVALSRVAAAGLVAPGGLLVVEHSRREAMPDAAPPLVLARREQYGDTALSFYSLPQGADDHAQSDLPRHL
ncbi:MAG: 16S rRNA (guanine(966)-N(2))-methyltransferase RsmD [Bacillota bacterium]|nr:16S rRNA (guanine(966)-N(2))-methyltransferase RsmD [Bacillota bacterium]